MAATKRMKRALVSVFHKDGLDEILKKLHSEGVSFVSTGGTQSFIESLGLPCDAVEDLTSYPSILGVMVVRGGNNLMCWMVEQVQAYKMLGLMHVHGR